LSDRCHSRMWRTSPFRWASFIRNDTCDHGLDLGNYDNRRLRIRSAQKVVRLQGTGVGEGSHLDFDVLIALLGCGRQPFAGAANNLGHCRCVMEMLSPVAGRRIQYGPLNHRAGAYVESRDRSIQSKLGNLGSMTAAEARPAAKIAQVRNGWLTGAARSSLYMTRYSTHSGRRADTLPQRVVSGYIAFVIGPLRAARER
jgi:hypothetical protein